MDVTESSHWVVGTSQIPNIDWRILVIIVGYYKLCWNLWIPHHLGLLGGWSWSLLLVLASKVVIHRVGRSRWFGEVEDRFVYLQIPNYDLSIFTRTGQNVGHDSVPADGGDSWTFMVIWYTWFENTWVLDVGGNVLNQHFGTSTGKQIFLMWIKLDGPNWSASVNLSSRDASLSSSEVVHWHITIKDLCWVPKCDGTIGHSTSNDASVTLVINPIEGCKCSWGFSYTFDNQAVWGIHIVFWDPQKGVLIWSWGRVGSGN